MRGRGHGQAGAGALRDQAGDRGPGGDAGAGARLPARRRPRADRGRAGAREDADDQDDGGGARRVVQPRAVHAGSRPVGSRRHARLPAGPQRVRDGARAGLLQLPARGRDQPRAGEGAVRAARGDAGAPGDDRAHDVPGPLAVPRARDAEPDRVRRHLPAPRGAGRPLHAEDPRRLPGARRGADRRRPLARGGARALAGALARGAAGAAGAGGAGVRRPGADQLDRRRGDGNATSDASTASARSPTTSRSARARAARSASCRRDARWR